MTTEIYDFLLGKGYKVYLPGAHKGECLEAHVVIKRSNSLPFDDYSTTQNLFDILCYVPGGAPSTLEAFSAGVKSALKEAAALYMIRPTGTENPDFYDDGKKAHMRSVQYVWYQRK